MSSYQSFNTNNIEALRKQSLSSSLTGEVKTLRNVAFVPDGSDEETTSRCCSKLCASCRYRITNLCIGKCPNVISKRLAKTCLKKRKGEDQSSFKPLFYRDFKTIIAASMEGTSKSRKRSPSTGVLIRPERKFKTTLAAMRKSSIVVLEKQRFAQHTMMDEEGNLLRPKPGKFIQQLKVIEEDGESMEGMEEKEQEVISSVNYVLQLKLDEAIARPCRPVDGYDEALLESDRTRSAKPISKNRRVSDSRISIRSLPSSMTNLNSIRKSNKLGRERGPRGLAAMTTPLFLALLPSLCEDLGHELMGDFASSLAYCKVLENIFSSAPHKRKDRYSSERWLAVVYIDYTPQKGIEAFRRLLIRFILHTYLIAFEERDISRDDVCHEFLHRPKQTQHYHLPYVYTHGIPIGGSDVMYTLHTQGKVDKIFKCSIMHPDRYSQWLHTPVENVVREHLTLKVPISVFPLVQRAMKGGKSVDTSLSSEDDAFLVEGVAIMIKANRLWNEKMQNKYVEPRLLLYLQLDSTMWNVLCLMEEKLKNSLNTCSSRFPAWTHICDGKG